jgi:AraC-like DNA-binding protein
MGVATYLPGATYGPRNMVDYELVWIIDGNCEYRRDETTVAAPPGSIVLCRPGARDFFQWDREHRTRHAYVHFNVEAVPETWAAQRDWPLVRRADEGDILRPLFRHLLSWGPRADTALRDVVLTGMMAAYVTGQVSGGDVPYDAVPDAVDRALRHIRQSLDRDSNALLGLGELARAADVTPEHLCRLFKNSTGRSPGETVRLARLDRAMVLLGHSNYTVAEVARMCGFASPFHFSRRFKQAFGYSPRDVRLHLSSGAVPPSPRSQRWSVD